MNASIPGFTAGELSGLLEGRADLEALKTGCRRMRNMIPHKLGAAMQRPGFIYAGTQHDQTAVARMIPFVFAEDVVYKIELGHHYARVWSNNSLVLSGGIPLVVTTPWAGSEVGAVRTSQANDVMWMTHRSYPARRLVRYAHDDWRLEAIPLAYPPLRDMNVTSTAIAASGASLAVGAVVTLTATTAVFAQGDIGGHYALSHRRDIPFAQIDLAIGSGTATQVLTLSVIPVVGETFSIGTYALTWSANVDIPGVNQVSIGADYKAAAVNASLAITGTAGAGVGPGTPANPYFTAAAAYADVGIKATGRLSFIKDDGLTGYGSPDGFRIEGPTDDYSYYFSNAAHGLREILRGATWEDSIANAAKAISGTGIAYPGVGYNYGTGTVAHTDVVAALSSVARSIDVTATVGGVGGNAIETTIIDTSRMQWGAGALTGGAAAGSSTVTITARKAGEGVNEHGVVLGETMTNGAWNESVTVGGKNVTLTSDEVRVNGQWEVYTYGRWAGTLTLQQKNPLGVWETLRTYSSENDHNVESTGVIDGEKQLRLSFVGTGEVDDDAPPRAVLSALDSMITGYVEILAVAPDGLSATGTVRRALHSTAATADWSEGAWSTRRGFPAAVTLHEQRLVFGRDGAVWGSRLADFDDFERTGLDDASYSYDLASTEANRIVSLASHRGLIVMTDGDEWLLDGGPQSSAITANNRRAQLLSGYGSAPVQSVMIGSAVCFVQRGGTALNEYVFDFQSDGYDAVDMTELAEHLATEGITSLAWAPNPHAILWCVTATGSLLSMVYRRKAGMIAWTKHTTPHGYFESVCSAPGANGVSEVWVTLRRTVSAATVRTVERIDTDHYRKVAAGEGLLLNVADGAVVYSGAPATVVTGLSHLEGLTIGVLADGAAHPARTVAAGQITLSAAASSVIVGLPPSVELQPMGLELPSRAGSSVGRQLRVSKIDARFHMTGACRYADDETKVTDGVYDVPFRAATDPVGAAVPLFSGLKKLDLGGGHLDATRVILRNDSMLPLHVLSLVMETVVSGT